MNPVENAWAIMKQEVEKRLPTTLDQLKLIIQDVWENLETQNLCLSMHNRIAQCVTLEGHTINY